MLQIIFSDQPTVTGRVELTRVNPDSIIAELLENSKLDQLEETTECEYLIQSINNANNSNNNLLVACGLKLFIGRDGKASLGSNMEQHGLKFKQVVMDPR